MHICTDGWLVESNADKAEGCFNGLHSYYVPSVGRSVSLYAHPSVSNGCEFYKNGIDNQVAIWDCGSDVPKESCIRSRSPQFFSGWGNGVRQFEISIMLCTRMCV